MAIPYSTADLERLFSQLKLIKTPSRNSLKEDTLNGLIISKIGLNLLDLEDKMIGEQLLAKLRNYYSKMNEIKKVQASKRKNDEILHPENQDSVLKKTRLTGNEIMDLEEAEKLDSSKDQVISIGEILSEKKKDSSNP